MKQSVRIVTVYFKLFMFNKDLLVFDLEATGLDFRKHEIIQIGCVRLDRDTLEEVDSWMSYVRPTHWENADPESLAVNHITWEQLEDAPSAAEMLSVMTTRFSPKDVLLSGYNLIFDVPFLKATFWSQELPYAYDYHAFDIFPMVYWYLNTIGALPKPEKFVGFNLSDATRALGIEASGFHDALVDARVTAEIIRKLMDKIETKK